MYTDLHTHTTFSDGANSVSEMVEEAIRKGFSAIGIADHSFTPYDLRYCMKAEDQNAYLKQIAQVKEQYRDQIEVYAGLEYDICGEVRDRQRFDYLIGSCHYVKTCDGYRSVDHAEKEHREVIERYFYADPMAYAKTYFETYENRTKICRPDILGHFDLVSKFGLVHAGMPAYCDLALDALISCLKVTPIMELNTGAVVRGWRSDPFPQAFLLKELLAHGGKVILSSDAHRTAHLAGWFDQACALLKEIGFSSMIVRRKGEFEEVGLPQ